jgi:hypothetical protein
VRPRFELPTFADKVVIDAYMAEAFRDLRELYAIDEKEYDAQNNPVENASEV